MPMSSRGLTDLLLNRGVLGLCLCSGTALCLFHLAGLNVCFTLCALHSSSLTEKATLKDLDNIREQIYQIKDGDKVCFWSCHLTSSPLGCNVLIYLPCVKDIPMVIVGTKMDLVCANLYQWYNLLTCATHRAVSNRCWSRCSSARRFDRTKSTLVPYVLYTVPYLR